MSVVVTRIRPNPKDGTDCQPVPTKEDGTRYTWACRYSGYTRTAWSDSVAGLVSALAGEPDYETMTPQEQCVVRIRCAIRLIVAVQANLLLVAQNNGDFDALTDGEREILMAPRVEQPAPEMSGFNMNLFEVPYWSAPVPLLLLVDGYIGRPLPRGPQVWYVEAGESDEALLESLNEHHIIEVLHVEDDLA